MCHLYQESAPPSTLVFFYRLMQTICWRLSVCRNATMDPWMQRPKPMETYLPFTYPQSTKTQHQRLTISRYHKTPQVSFRCFASTCVSPQGKSSRLTRLLATVGLSVWCTHAILAGGRMCSANSNSYRYDFEPADSFSFIQDHLCQNHSNLLSRHVTLVFESLAFVEYPLRIYGAYALEELQRLVKFHRHHQS